MSETVSAVRGAVILGGQTILQGWRSLEVENNSYASADTFSVDFAANALPASNNAAWLSQQTDGYIGLYAGIPANPLQWSPSDLPQWIYGQIDKIDYNPRKGIITVKGRDLTRMFIDAKTTEKFQNATSSQVATLLAKRHGLTPQVTATATPIGKYYEIDHDAMNNARTEWDVLTYLARIEQFVVYVRGKTLFFQPRPDPSTVTPYALTWTPSDALTGYPTGNMLDLDLGRALTISRRIIVVVRSFNDAAGQSFTSTCTASSTPNAAVAGAVGTSSQPQTYYYNVPNLDQRGCDRLAKAKYKEIIQHEMTMMAELPAAGNDALDVTSLVSLSGTGTAWDSAPTKAKPSGQFYYPDSITRSLSFSDGYKLTLHAKNHAPDSQDVGGGE